MGKIENANRLVALLIFQTEIRSRRNLINALDWTWCNFRRRVLDIQWSRNFALGSIFVLITFGSV